jgi:hypothetical protein
MRRILVVLVTVLISGLFVTSTAQAGNWEETLLDPTPARIDPGVTYTFGYWILQHGSYPFGGDLGPTALVATDGKGDTVEFAGIATKTAAHYSAEVVFPHEGTWTIGSEHDVLMPDALVATVVVPGAVTIAPSEMTDRAAHDWGTVKPSFPPNAAGTVAEPAAPAVPEQVAPAVAPRSQQATVDEPGMPLPWGAVVLAGLATVGLAVWLGRRRVRANR